MNAMPGPSHTRRNPAWRFVPACAATLLAISAACTNANEPRGSIRIEPASATVPLGPMPATSGFVVPVTITNTTNETIYRSGCGGYSVEQSILAGAEGPRLWVHVWSPICSLPAEIPPIPIAPGESVTITVDTRGSGLGRSTVWEGQYRVKVGLAAQLFGEFYLLSEEQSASTPFSVV
jgi:hypothetical protein